ncbi:MAG: ATP-binding protein [Candidatus Methanoplasma sp.]|nr:ATP-binding protein [Candidatus Methanoplasma sp.]
MIARTVYEAIERSISQRPVTLITGARQVGKTTLCRKLSKDHGFGYVTLADRSERALAADDPDMFLRSHRTPLIIDEAQYAPGLFDSLESVVDKAKFDTGRNEGMYVLTGSQAYNLMENVTQSMAGRISIIRMSPLSQSEILSRPAPPFTVDFEKNIARSSEYVVDADSLFRMIVRGAYPELYDNPDVRTSEFYSDYVDSYINKDASQIINLKDQNRFHEFMQLVASLTGQELVYGRIANTLGVDIKTVQSWISVLAAGDIIHLLQPYSARSTVKRIVKRPKVYFCDTGLACHLAKATDAETLRAGYLKGPMVETFIVNEILKSYSNNREQAGFYYYRDSSMNEIDLVMLRNGTLSLVECRSGMTFGASDVKAFGRMDKSDYTIGPSCIICLTEKPYPISKNVYALPVTAI